MLTVLVILLFACIVFYDYIPLIRGKKKKECQLYGCFLAVSFVTLILSSLNIFLPSPLNPLRAWIENTFLK